MKSLRLTSVLVKIWTDNLPNTSVERCRYTKLLSDYFIMTQHQRCFIHSMTGGQLHEDSKVQTLAYVCTFLVQQDNVGYQCCMQSYSVCPLPTCAPCGYDRTGFGGHLIPPGPLPPNSLNLTTVSLVQWMYWPLTQKSGITPSGSSLISQNTMQELTSPFLTSWQLLSYLISSQICETRRDIIASLVPTTRQLNPFTILQR